MWGGLRWRVHLRAVASVAGGAHGDVLDFHRVSPANELSDDDGLGEAARAREGCEHVVFFGVEGYVQIVGVAGRDVDRAVLVIKETLVHWRSFQGYSPRCQGWELTLSRCLAGVNPYLTSDNVGYVTSREMRIGAIAGGRGSLVGEYGAGEA